MMLPEITPVNYIMLRFLSSKDNRERNGNDVRKFLADKKLLKTDSAFTQGMNHMEKRGWVSSRFIVEKTEKGNLARMRYFKIEDDGIKQIVLMHTMINLMNFRVID